MPAIHDSRGKPVTVRIHKSATLRDGRTITGQVIHAEAGRFPPDPGKQETWFITETIRDEHGAEHRVRLMGSALSIPLDSKPYLVKFSTQVEAEAAARTIRRIATAHSEGRIAWERIALPQGSKTFVIGRDGVAAPPSIAYTEREAREEAESLILRDPEAMVRVRETAGIVPQIPYGVFIDHEDAKEWIKANIRPGLLLVLEQTHAGLNLYHPVRVLDHRPRQGTFRVEKPSGTLTMSSIFYVSGKDYDAPTGQARVLPPVREAVALALEQHRPRADHEIEAALYDDLAALAPIDWPWTLPPSLGGPERPAKPKRVPTLARVDALQRQGIGLAVGASPVTPEGENGTDEDDGDWRSIVQIRGSKKDVHWAHSTLDAFCKRRSVDPLAADLADDDLAVLGCSHADLIIASREILRNGDAAGFVAANGIRWLEFDAIDDYRVGNSEMFLTGGRGPKETGKAWHRHIFKVAGVDHVFHAVGAQRWIFKGDHGRFAFFMRNGVRHLLEGTLRTVDRSGKVVIRGSRLAKR